MTRISFPYSSLVLAALIAVGSLTPLHAADVDVDVVDPTSGETVSIADIDFDALTDDERADIGDQLAEQGISPRGGRRAGQDLSDVEVVDPTTGETVSLGDIDVQGLTDEDRAAIGDQLAEQGISSGGRGRGGQGGGGRGGPRD